MKGDRRMKKKGLALALALVLVVTVAIGGTLAWLTDRTPEVKNVFTTAGIDIELTETMNTDSNNDGTADCWQAQLVPGYEYAKDPEVSVSADSVDCYLFVKFAENNTPKSYLSYTSELTATNGWTQGDGTSIPANVWYRKVMASDTTRSWELLKDNKIAVSNTLTAMPAADKMPELVYTAYATQLYSKVGTEFSAAAAWTNASK